MAKTHSVPSKRWHIGASRVQHNSIPLGALSSPTTNHYIKVKYLHFYYTHFLIPKYESFGVNIIKLCNFNAIKIKLSFYFGKLLDVRLEIRSFRTRSPYVCVSPLSYSGVRSWLCVRGVYGSASGMGGGSLYMVFGTMSVCVDEMFLLHKHIQASQSVLLEVISTNQLYCVNVLCGFVEDNEEANSSFPPFAPQENNLRVCVT